MGELFAHNAAIVTKNHQRTSMSVVTHGIAMFSFNRKGIFKSPHRPKQIQN